MEEEELVHCHMGHKMITLGPDRFRQCDACGSDIGEALYLGCTECDVTVHRKCAQLPKQIDHPMHPEHHLLLLTKSVRSMYSKYQRRCQVCKEVIMNKVLYRCSSCDFDIHVVCASLREGEMIGITIPNHHHQVMLIPRPATFRCNACDVEGKDGESYVCTKPPCSFWIHKRCGSLPELFQRPDHGHPLRLAIRMPDRYRRYKFTCEICLAGFRSSGWIYYCHLCKYFVHVKCMRGKAPSQLVIKYYDSPINLVMISEMKTITEHRVGASYVEKAHHDYFKQLQDRPFPQVKVVDSHTHPLVLFSGHLGRQDDLKTKPLCDGCIENIECSSSPYYKCGHSCNFFLHTTCANLPEDRVVGDHHHHVHRYAENQPELKLYFPMKAWEAVQCTACKSFCNGYGYKCTISGCKFYLDIKCSYLVGDIKHVGHNHLLRSYGSSHWMISCFRCTSCGDIRQDPFFQCADCNLKIGYECATLPETVTHRWDKQQLILTFPPYFRDSPNADEEFYCEVCEDEIHPKRWIYRCAECDQSFHPHCIPTLGECRNIKFGKTFSVQSHPHPLTMVPQAVLSSRCYYCRKSLNWSRAYECAPCGFYLCPDCLPKEELVGTWE